MDDFTWSDQTVFSLCILQAIDKLGPRVGAPRIIDCVAETGVGSQNTAVLSQSMHRMVSLGLVSATDTGSDALFSITAAGRKRIVDCVRHIRDVQLYALSIKGDREIDAA